MAYWFINQIIQDDVDEIWSTTKHIFKASSLAHALEKAEKIKESESNETSKSPSKSPIIFYPCEWSAVEGPFTTREEAEEAEEA